MSSIKGGKLSGFEKAVGLFGNDDFGGKADDGLRLVPPPPPPPAAPALPKATAGIKPQADIAFSAATTRTIVAPERAVFRKRGAQP